ncbi:MAG: hypothetical protein SF123_25485 [Chloroflexota bacterium]|nr:hypothetical protein [Chloroflexota bacterium]
MDKLRNLVRNQFERDYGNIKRVVKAELHREFGVSEAQRNAGRARAFGLFVSVVANRLGIAPAALADKTGMEVADVEKLLKGETPAEALHDDLLVKLASAIHYQPEVLRIMLGRSRDDSEVSA